MNDNPQGIDTGAPEAPAIDVDAILTLHADPDGYIGFGRKPDPATAPRDAAGKPKAWENLFAIRADDLRRMLPAVANWLAQDSYYTVNAYYRAARWRNSTTGLPDTLRKESDLSRLTACYSDIDCGRPDSAEPGAALEWRQAQFEATVLADRGIIPRPSIMARSGRGVYLLWLLRDEKDPTIPPKAWPNRIALYKELNRALNARLRDNHLPADRAAIDAARVLRVPGSIHRKTGRRVEYVIELDQTGRGFVYTLPELASLLEIKAPIGELPEATRAEAKPQGARKGRRTINPGSAPARINGLRRVNALRADDMLTVETWRRGFKKRGEKYADGTISPGRRRLLVMYASFLKNSGAPLEDATKALRTMAANMQPPYPQDSPDATPSVDEIARAEYQCGRRWKRATMCEMLGITADTARELELKTIRPEEVALEADAARPTQADLVALRREFAWQYLEKHRRVTARGLANVYHHAGFKGANRQTANKDLNALGYVMARPKGGRPRKAARVGK